MILKISSLLKGFIISPSDLFKRIKEGMYKKEIIFLFLVGSLIALGKSFYHEANTINFYSSDRINMFFSFLSIPQITWGLSYILHFFYIYTLYIVFNKIDKKKFKFEPILYSILALSSLGVIFQVLFLLLNLVIPHNILFFMSTMITLWVILLTLKALHIIYGLSYSKTFLGFIISSAFFLILIGFSIVSPSLAWITTNIFN